MKWKNWLRVNNLFFFIYLLPISISAQKIVNIKQVKGISIINDNLSYKEAKLEALNDAKINALKQAGVIENINSYQVLMSTQGNKDFSQFFSSGILTDLQGAVSKYNITKDYYYNKKSENELTVEVEISAEVILYDSKADPEFEIKLEGLKGIYLNKENLEFTITPTIDCYLKVFNWNQGDANLIYPNSYESSIKLEKGKKISFPLLKMNYLLKADENTDEKSKLLFVFTKKDLAFINVNENGSISLDNLFNWLSLIPLDQKKVFSKSILIQVNN
jgi:hypothetical protein